jgi:FKBP-type peptidyl-prolyl cis-trans isomerase FkpA
MTDRRLIVSMVMVALSLGAAGCGDSPTEPTLPRGEYSQTDVRVGTGAEAVNGRTVALNYVGWFYEPSGQDGKGSRFEGPASYSFVLGGNQVISGWNRAIPGMRIGGVRRFVLPPELAYGATGSGPIPPNATLVFEVELVNVQ